MRIHVAGNAGAGKTTLARELGKRLNLPVVHLDGVVWQSGWKRTPPAEKAESFRRIAKSTTWIVDGVSRIIRERADIVVFLDVPRRACLRRCLRRSWRHLFRARPELPRGCPEYLILPSLLKIIWQFPILVGAEIRSEAAQSSKYVVVRNEADLQTWLAALQC